MYLMRLTQFDKLKKGHLDFKDWILKCRLSLFRVKCAWMDYFDIQNLRDVIPFDPTGFKRRWNMMVAWEAYRFLENREDPLLTFYEVERRINLEQF